MTTESKRTRKCSNNNKIAFAAKNSVAKSSVRRKVPSDAPQKDEKGPDDGEMVDFDKLIPELDLSLFDFEYNGGILQHIDLYSSDTAASCP